MADIFFNHTLHVLMVWSYGSHTINTTAHDQHTCTCLVHHQCLILCVFIANGRQLVSELNVAQSNALIIYYQAKHAKLNENTDEASNKDLTDQQYVNSDSSMVELRIRIPDGQVLHMLITCQA